MLSSLDSTSRFSVCFSKRVRALRSGGASLAMRMQSTRPNWRITFGVWTVVRTIIATVERDLGLIDLMELSSTS